MLSEKDNFLLPNRTARKRVGKKTGKDGMIFILAQNVPLALGQKARLSYHPEPGDWQAAWPCLVEHFLGCHHDREPRQCPYNEEESNE